MIRTQYLQHYKEIYTSLLFWLCSNLCKFDTFLYVYYNRNWERYMCRYINKNRLSKTKLNTLRVRKCYFHFITLLKKLSYGVSEPYEILECVWIKTMPSNAVTSLCSIALIVLVRPRTDYNQLCGITVLIPWC